MNLNNPESNEVDRIQETNDESNVTNKAEENSSQIQSATTSDIPAFGWSAYAERMNGRFAMVGFLAVLLIEALSNESFLHWAGFMPK